MRAAPFAMRENAAKGDGMGKRPKLVKRTLPKVLERMEADPSGYVRDPAGDFTRRRKLGLKGTMWRVGCFYRSEVGTSSLAR